MAWTRFLGDSGQMLDIVGKKYGPFEVKRLSHYEIRKKADVAIWICSCPLGHSSYIDQWSLDKLLWGECSRCLAMQKQRTLRVREGVFRNRSQKIKPRRSRNWRKELYRHIKTEDVKLRSKMAIRRQEARNKPRPGAMPNEPGAWFWDSDLGRWFDADKLAAPIECKTGGKSGYGPNDNKWG